MLAFPGPTDGGGFDLGFQNVGFGDIFIDPGMDPGAGVNIDISGIPNPVGGGGGGGTSTTNQTLTQIVDSFEAALKANLAAWQTQAKTPAAALETAWRLMNGMVTEVRKFGAAGTKAAAERDRRVNPAMLRWDWIAYYIDPITGSNTTLPPVPGGPVATGPNGTLIPQPAPNVASNPLLWGAAIVGLLFLLRKQ